MQNELQPEWTPLEKLEFIERGCPVCKSEDGRPLHQKRVAGYDMSYWLCCSCNSVYARTPVADRCLRTLFGSMEFFQAGNPAGDNIDYFDFIGGEKYLRKTARGRINRIRQYKPSGKMLEVASAAGFFLIEAKEAGYDVQGVEISAPMAQYASARWGVPVIGESIEAVELRSEYYDVIASWGVMTILRDPIAAIRKFHRALRPGGFWAFNTYYHDGLWHRLVGARWNILVVQTSQIFSKQNIIELASKEGFQLMRRRRDWPHTDLLKIADQLGQNIGWRWMPDAVKSIGMQNFIVTVPVPDVYEYIWRKR